MDRKVKSFRLRVDLQTWLKSYAQTRGSTEIAVLEQAILSFKRDTEGGVPDLPSNETVVVSVLKPDEAPAPGTVAAKLEGQREKHLRMAREMGWAS